MLRVFTLSNPRIELKKGEPVKLVSKKAVGLYIYLALNPGKHSREFLSDLFWPDAIRERAAGNLRVVISNIRKNLPDFLEVTNQYVSVIQDGRIWIDLITVRKLVDMEDFNKALDLYRGDFLPGFHLRGADRFENWQVIESEKIRIEILEKLSHSVGRLLKGGDYETAIPLLKRLIVFEPLQESAHQQLMKAYFQVGNSPLAMKQFVECEEVLRRELGVTPSAATIAIYDQIRKERPLSEGVKKAPHNLPSYSTKFVGRKNIIRNIENSLHNEAARLVTLLGPGGMGKTRLAMEVASRNLEYFEDGVFWIPLRPVSDANAIASSISEGIGYSARNNDGNFDSLIEHLSERKILLVCDNFEHLTSNAKILLDLLTGAPNLKILVTSRQRLNLQGEFVKLVGGLTVPEGKLEAITPKKLEPYAAMQVFLNAEKRANPSSKLTLAKANLIAQICGQLEGMPLALELAAGWRGALGLQEILSEIEQRNRLEFLTSDLEGIEERHKSLAKLASQSLNRLAKEEQRIFLGLCFMKGGFTRIAAEKISGASLENMISLLGKSFIQRDREGTFRIHEFLRQFGINQLENDKQRHLRIRDRYVTYYSHLMEKSWWEAWSGEIKPLKREWVNIGRAFLLAAESRNFEAVRRMIVPFAFSSVVGENFATSTILFGKVAEKLRGKAKTEDEIRTWALVSTQEGYFAGTQGQFDRGIKAFAEARSLLDERRESLEFAWLALYEPLAEVGAEYERMRANVEKALMIFEHEEEPFAISVALNSLGNFSEGDISIGFHKRALVINRAHNGTRDQAWSLIGIGIRQMIQGNLPRALENVNKATQKYTSIQYSTGMAWGHGTLGQIFQKSKNFEGARRHYEKAIRIWRDGGWKYKGLGTVELLGTLDILEGKYVDATAHFIEVTEKSLQMVGKQMPNWIVPAEECALLAKFGQTRLALIANRYTRKDLFAEEMWGGLDIQFEEFKQNISTQELDRINKEVRIISPYELAVAIREALQDIQFQLSGDEKNLHV